MSENDDLVNYLTGKSNVVYPTDFHRQTSLDDIVDNIQEWAIARVILCWVELSPNLPHGIPADKKFSNQYCSSFLTTLSILLSTVKLLYTFAQNVFVSECLCIGVPVERLSLDNSKLMPLQRLRFEVRDSDSKDWVQRFPEKAIAPLIENYLYPERSL